jgi:hypothetical protein
MMVIKSFRKFCLFSAISQNRRRNLPRQPDFVNIFGANRRSPEGRNMRKKLALAVIVLFLANMAQAFNKESGSTTLKDVQPAGTTDKQHKKQQFDLSFSSSTNDYTCRTNENQKVQATQFVVGSSITYKIDGNKGQVKDAASGKNAKCTVMRVAPLTAPSQ